MTALRPGASPPPVSTPITCFPLSEIEFSVSWSFFAKIFPSKRLLANSALLYIKAGSFFLLTCRVLKTFNQHITLCRGSEAVKRARLRQAFSWKILGKSRFQRPGGLVPSGVRILPPAKAFWEKACEKQPFRHLLFASQKASLFWQKPKCAHFSCGKIAW